MKFVKKLSKIISVIIVLSMLLSNVTAFASEREITASGVYGEVNWTLYSDGELVISGQGKTGNDWRDTVPIDAVTKVTIEEGITFISGSAFNGYNKIAEISLPSTLETVYEIVFNGCTSLKNVYYNGDVAGWCSLNITNGEYSLFNYAENLYIGNTLVTDLIIPDGVTKIAPNVFCGYEKLSSITFPESMDTIGNAAFMDCTGLCELNLPDDSLIFIGNAAFRGCTGLNEINLPDSLISVGDYAFRDCTELNEISLPKNIENIGEYAFEGTAFYNDAANWDSGFLYIGNNLIKADYKKIASDCKVFSKTRLIASGAFKNYSSITNITMPDNIEYINSGAFYSCSKMKISSLPANLKSIGSGAFMYCVSFSDNSVEVPSSVISIGDRAFYGCNLKSIILNEGLQTIGTYVFADNYELTEINVPKTVTYLDESAFKSSSITDIYYGDTKSEWKRLASDVSIDGITVHYTLRNADDSVLIQHTDKNFIWEAGNVHLVVSEVTPATPSYDRNGYYIKNMINPVKVLDIKIVDGDGNPIQPLSDETITVKISAPYEFRDTVSAMLSEDGDIDFETVEFSDGTFSYEKDGKTVKVTLSDAELNKLKIVHWFSDGTEPGDYEVFKSDRMEIRDGYIILETNHFSEYAVCTEYVPEYTITFDTDGGTEIAPITLESGAAITPPINPEKEGYTFIGWSPEIPETMPAEDITVVAIYEKNDAPAEPENPTATVTGIEIIATPDKTDYAYKSAALDLSGIALKVTYSDGKSEIVTDTEQIKAYGFSASSVGTKTVTVAYGGYTDSFEITVSYTWWQMIIRILLLGFLWY